MTTEKTMANPFAPDAKADAAEGSRRRGMDLDSHDRGPANHGKRERTVQAREAKEVGPWLSIDQAAAILGVSVVTLRRAVERNARRASDRCTTSAIDGVRARKFGRRWRVALDTQWLEPLRATTAVRAGRSCGES